MQVFVFDEYIRCGPQIPVSVLWDIGNYESSVSKGLCLRQTLSSMCFTLLLLRVDLLTAFL